MRLYEHLAKYSNYDEANVVLDKYFLFLYSKGCEKEIKKIVIECEDSKMLENQLETLAKTIGMIKN